MKYWEVAVDAPLHKSLTYAEPEGLGCQIGRAVSVPLGRRQATGVVIGPGTQPNAEIETKNILGIEEHPILPAAYLRWATWLSRYYLHPVGQVFQNLFPPLKKTSNRKSRKPPLAQVESRVEAPALTQEQKAAVAKIREKSGFAVSLLFGVTGSGKTEVYLELLEDAIRENKQAIVLVPEISLTPQLIRRFTSRLGDAVAVIHSHLTDREKTDQWWLMVEQKKKVLIGARSALFCPLPELGLIILDEEHEPSFKQEEQLKYHARDAAIMLGRELRVPVILGSATPCLESWKNAQDGKYQLVELKERVESRPLPTVEVVDLRDVKSEKENDHKDSVGFWLSSVLHDKIKARLERGEQSALFLNRRGVAQVVLCPKCGHTVQCPNCSVTLTLHGKNHMTCHYCDYHENRKTECPECREGELKPLGLGTERIEEDLAKLFPSARIARADRDQIQNRADLEDLILRMEKRETDILIGTQMIAKGLDFTHLTLVGIVLADIGFNIPDFRASERSFQLLTQVSGRAGRHAVPGEVIVQTYQPQHLSVIHSQNHDYRGFAEQELHLRSELGYPPFGRMASIRLQGTDLNRVIQVARSLKTRFQGHLSNLSDHDLEILGPTEAPLAKLRGQHRYHLLLKSVSSQVLHSMVQKAMTLQFTGVKISVDIDPLNML